MHPKYILSKYFLVIPVDEVSDLYICVGITSLSNTGEREESLLTAESTVFIHVCEEGIFFQVTKNESKEQTQCLLKPNLSFQTKKMLKKSNTDMKRQMNFHFLVNYRYSLRLF